MDNRVYVEYLCTIFFFYYVWHGIFTVTSSIGIFTRQPFESSQYS